MSTADLRTGSPKRVALVTNELRGFLPGGGLGTATTFLAIALARMGHRAEIRCFRPPTRIDPYWGGLYAEAGVDLQFVPQHDLPIEPPHFARMHNVELSLTADPPDVVIVQDIGAPAYAALRSRHLGLGLEHTLFVVYCHGTRRWVTEMSRKIRVKNLSDLLGVSALERTSLELADVVVSPSAYLVEWMRGQRWQLPERTLVIPYLTRSGATGEPSPRPASTDRNGHVERLAFFGRLEEKKGLVPFAAGVSALEPALLEQLEVEFIGKATPAWPLERVEALLSETARRSLRRISFETALDQHEALDRLGRPGTLAVMPSLGDNSPNTVYECLERGISFIASQVGGIAELVDPADRARVLFEPTPEGVADALRRVLSEGEVPRPARPAFDDATSLARWAGVLATLPDRPSRAAERPAVNVVVVVEPTGSQEALGRCLAALRDQSYGELRVIVEPTRAAGVKAAEADWIIFLDARDVSERELVETLVQAQAASGADVVTCAVHLRDDAGPETLHFFPGEPGGLAVLSNGYGTVALLRRSLLGDLSLPWRVEDPDWPLLAWLSARGATIVSVPKPLVTRVLRPGSIERNPEDALLVTEHLGRGLPDSQASLARLAAGLAADAHASAPGSAGVFRRASDVLRNEGIVELVRRGGLRLVRSVR